MQQILGVICIGLSVLMVVALPNRDLDILTCDRTSQLCNVKRYSWRGEEKTSISINDLREAEVERRKIKDRMSYLLVLYTDNERFPVTYNSTVSRKESLAERVNSFLANPQDNGFSEQVEEIHIAKWIVAAIVAGLGVSAVVNKDSNRTV
jgi:hypothetical protein